MKKMIIIAFFAFLCVSAAFGQARPGVIIPAFDLEGGVTASERDTITRLFMGGLSNKRILAVVDRNKVEARMKEMQFQTSDWSNSAKTAEFNKGINATYLIIGTIAKMGNITIMDAMLEEISSFEVIGQATMRFTKPEEILDKIEGFVDTLVRNVQGATSSAPASRAAAVPEGFVRIPSGTFMMGSPSSEVNHESDEVQHQVTVSAFYMGKYEVTQAEYQAVIGANPSNFKGGNLPVEKVSWFDAVHYCNERSKREGLTPVYTINGDNTTWNKKANGYRLPTEAEWEYACRAGTTTPFSTGFNITTGQANYNGNYPYNNNAKGTYREKTTAVGSFASNAYGLFDMHGNVWEWCWDWYGGYSVAAQTDPSGPTSGSGRVDRGGSWYYDARHLRSARRGNRSPSDPDSNLGFRLVRSEFLGVGELPVQMP